MQSQPKPSPSANLLSWSGKIWFAVAATGQAVFILYILGFYGPRTATGNYEAWNDGQIITGFVPGDLIGNLVFGSHVLLAALITLGGLLQLTPALRHRYPALHRWNGRLFLTLAMIMALGGLWATWFRGSHLSIVSGLSVSLNGVLIIIFASFTLRHAIARRIAVHERWAMRTFMAVSGVWFFRVGLMAWVVVNQGPVGMTEDLTGPADIALSVSSYALPLAALEIYQAAKRSPSAWAKIGAASLTLVLTLVTAIGVLAASAFMWLPALGVEIA